MSKEKQINHIIDIYKRNREKACEMVLKGCENELLINITKYMFEKENYDYYLMAVRERLFSLSEDTLQKIIHDFHEEGLE